MTILTLLQITFSGEVFADGEQSEPPPEPTPGVYTEDAVQAFGLDSSLLIPGSNTGTTEENGSRSGSTTDHISRFFESWETVGDDFSCDQSGDSGDYGGCIGIATVCPVADAVVSFTNSEGDYSTLPTLQEGTRTDRVNQTSQDLGVRCYSALVGDPAAGGAAVVITVTREDFAKLPVIAPEAHAGPVDGWVPVNMDVVLYTDAEDQTLETSVLGIPVQIRAIPVSYTWDLGDGNTITTSESGRPYPAKDVTGTYRYEGWYDVTLTTTYAGQFSVAGGPWQDIEGTIDVASEPVALFSKSLESRLVDGDVPVDEDADPWIPARSPDTEGPQDPEARDRSL
ncbi:PKD domain-containing protein [Brachybacterium phenoliresistens]|uniref:PKD domain-containing protein n=1 Tax=Brachybacterium phenoliresistens TaxID=396014 RepID=UPI0031CFC8C6